MTAKQKHKENIRWRWVLAAAARAVEDNSGRGATAAAILVRYRWLEQHKLCQTAASSTLQDDCIELARLGYLRVELAKTTEKSRPLLRYALTKTTGDGIAEGVLI